MSSSSRARSSTSVGRTRKQNIGGFVFILIFAFCSLLSNWYNVKGFNYLYHQTYDDDETTHIIINTSSLNGTSKATTTTATTPEKTPTKKKYDSEAVKTANENLNTTTTTIATSSLNNRINISSSTTRETGNNDIARSITNATSRAQEQELILQQQQQQQLRLSEEQLRNHTYLTIPSRDPQWESILKNWKDRSRQIRLNHIKELAKKEPLANWKKTTQQKQVLTKEQKAYIKPGVWIHVGKAGGTTLQNIVESRPGSSRYKSSYMAQLVRRCHMGGCNPIDLGEFEFFIWLIRDPFERTGSAFEYMHPTNNLSPRNLLPKYKRFTGFTECFDTYEKFAYYLDNTTTTTTTLLLPNNNSNIIHNFNTTMTTNDNSKSKPNNCWTKAQGLLQHQHPCNKDGSGGHLYWDTGFWVNKIKDAFPILLLDEKNGTTKYNNNYNDSNSNSNNSNKTGSNNNTHHPYMFVIRNENFWDDYKMVNWLLGQNWTTIKTYEQMSRGKDYSQKNYPITRTNLTSIGKQRLCNALEREYQDYFWVLKQAANLGPADIDSALEIAHKNCPNMTNPLTNY